MTRGSRVRLRDLDEHCARKKKRADKEIVEGIKIELLPATTGSGERCENNRRKKVRMRG